MANNARREPILKLANIHKAFGGVQALAGVDFELYPGEIHALVGENGAGKSTMVKVITGVHQIDEGEILFRDEPVSIPNPQYAQRLGIAAIYQEATVFPDLDIAESNFTGRHPVWLVTQSVAWRHVYKETATPTSTKRMRARKRSPQSWQIPSSSRGPPVWTFPVRSS